MRVRFCGVPCFSYSLIYPKTLFKIKAPRIVGFSVQGGGLAGDLRRFRVYSKPHKVGNRIKAK